VRTSAAGGPEVAVVIATCRRPDLLRRCLVAVLAQRGLAPQQYEVVVVDDGPCEATRLLVAGLAERTAGQPLVRYMRSLGTRGPAGARNRGWRAATAGVIAFTDDDTVPDAGWLAHGLQALAGRVAVGGRVVVPVVPPLTDHARNTRGLETAEFVTANAFVRRAALQAVGGFDERFTRAWREDSDLQFSLIERYGDVGRAPDAVVEHPVRAAPWGISLAQQQNVYFDALLYAKHRALFRARVRNAPPWHYLLIVASGVVALVAAALGQAAAALALACGCLAGCLAFAGFRLHGASLAPAHVAEMLVTSIAIPFLALYWRLRGAWHFRTLYP
jgi:GT2 family glycosyltransferase